MSSDGADRASAAWPAWGLATAPWPVVTACAWSPATWSRSTRWVCARAPGRPAAWLAADRIVMAAGHRASTRCPGLDRCQPHAARLARPARRWSLLRPAAGWPCRPTAWPGADDPADPTAARPAPTSAPACWPTGCAPQARRASHRAGRQPRLRDEQDNFSAAFFGLHAGVHRVPHQRRDLDRSTRPSGHAAHQGGTGRTRCREPDPAPARRPHHAPRPAWPPPTAGASRRWTCSATPAPRRRRVHVIGDAAPPRSPRPATSPTRRPRSVPTRWSRIFAGGQPDRTGHQFGLLLDHHRRTQASWLTVQSSSTTR
jgi:hypothetical protein